MIIARIVLVCGIMASFMGLLLQFACGGIPSPSEALAQPWNLQVPVLSPRALRLLQRPWPMSQPPMMAWNTMLRVGHETKTSLSKKAYEWLNNEEIPLLYPYVEVEDDESAQHLDQTAR